MSVEIKLPSLGEGIETADVAEVLVVAGDTVEAGQVLMELETDKAVVPVPSDQSGVVEAVHVSQGDTVTVGQVIVRITNAESKSSPPVQQQMPMTSEPSANDLPETPQASSTSDATTNSNQKSSSSFSSRVTVKLPSLGEGIVSADVAEVRVAVGDKVTSGQTLIEVETEKAVSEVPSDAAGIVREVLVSQGQTISIDAPLIVLDSEDTVAQTQGPTPSRNIERTGTSQPRVEKSSGDNGKQPVQPIVIDSRSGTTGMSPVPAAPSTRRLARQLGVELRLVSGSGPGGRITRDDVQEFVKGQLTGLSRPQKSQITSTRSVGGLMPPPLPDFSKYGEIEREKLNKIGRTAAENLLVSWHVIPHVTHHDRADITELEEARKRFTTGAGKNVAKVTMTAIVIKALAKCLQGFPKFNSSLDPETYEIVYKKFINIGCAVDTPSGLVVPVIRDCGRKSIVDIAGELNQLAEQARDRKLSLEAMQGATCTVTNLGGIGGLGFTPIVNYPEVCILGMSRSQKELQLVEGQVKERLMLPLSLSYDHRVINGADAARFLVAMCGMLSDPFQLLSMI